MKKLLNIYKKYEEIINYLIVGGLTCIVGLGTKFLLLFTIFSPKKAIELQIAIIVSWIVAVLFAYVTNRKFVFKSQNNNRLKEFIVFIMSRILTLLLEMIIMWFFVTLLKFDSNYEVIIWTIVAQVVVVIGNYLFSKLLVFKK